MKANFAGVMLAAMASADSSWPSIDLTAFKEETFDNLIDHFNFLDDRTYKQRYWVSDQYWDGTGPQFIYICGEYRCSVPDTRLYPFMVGAEHNARFLVLEHRFYGDSQPFDTWELENFGKLNSEQALADLAYFIGAMNPKNENQVLVIGGSYPGALSAWFRNRYPHLAVGAWSSSGVVQPIVDFWQFDEQTYTSTLKSGDYCPLMIQQTIEFATQVGEDRDNGSTTTIIDALLQGTGAEGMRTDDWMFYYADIFLESVQYGNRTKLCKLFEAVQGTNDDIIKYMTEFGHNVANVNPADYDTRIIAETKVDPMSSARPWTFQYCSEYGWFQVPSQKNVMRSTMLSEDYWHKMCQRSFGPGMPLEPRANQTTIDQGGWDIGVTNIFFANGVEDPWRWAAKQGESNQALNQVVRISDCENCGHCVELYTPSESDADELKETRQRILSWVGQLLENTKKEPVEFLQ